MSENTAIIYGFHSVKSFLSHHADRVIELVIDEARHDKRMQEILDLAKSHAIKIRMGTKKDLLLLAEHENHQGVVGIVQGVDVSQDFETFLDSTEPSFLLILDGIQDPHNLGACIRTANAAGVDAVIAPKNRAAGMTPVVNKVASGATSVTPFFQVTNLVQTLKLLKDRGIWIYGTTEHAHDTYQETVFTKPLALVMGSEEKGLRRLTQEHCDFLISIPMKGSVSSLNVSVATGICLFEIVRQHNEKK